MRRKLGAPPGQKQRIIDFVGSRDFTVAEVVDAVNAGTLKDVVARNVDRYIGTMCQIGQVERTGVKLLVGKRRRNVYRATGAKASSRPRIKPIPTIPPTKSVGLSHETLFDIGRKFGTLLDARPEPVEVLGQVGAGVALKVAQAGQHGLLGGLPDAV